MKKTFIFNGKTYNTPAFTFKDLCEMEDLGFDAAKFAKRPMNQILIVSAFMLRTDLDTAAKEIEAHIVNGGKLDDILAVMQEGMESSDFFRSLSKETYNAGTKLDAGKERDPQ